MKLRSTRVIRLSVFLSLVCSLSAHASVITLDFEGLADGTDVGATYSSLGAAFSNASIATSGISLNEFDFPPHSGENVALDSGGPITILFSNSVSSLSGFLTYAVPVQVAAFDDTGTQVASASSLFDSNFTSSGNTPNELIAVDYAPGFDRVVLTGDPAGSSFVVDDISFNTSVESGAVPEPGTFTLLSFGFAAISGGIIRRLSRR